MHDDDALLSQVVEGIQGALRGDTAELDELLDNVLLVRKPAVQLYMVHAKGNADDQKSIPPTALPLLESFILQLPKFCARWLGKPPTAKDGTRDYLRYDQRRQRVLKPLHQVIDSTLMVTKTRLDDNTVVWETLESSLHDCLALLEYLGDLVVPDAAGSPFVKISYFYYRQHTILSRESEDVQHGRRAWRALQRSIECVKHRPAEEKEHARFIVKLERAADLGRSSGRIDEALGALQSVRASLVSDGVLESIATRSASEPLASAWTSCDKARSLSRILCSIDKLEHVWLDWTTGLRDTERLAALEHRLYSILLKNTKLRRSLTMANP
ncbi:MAG: hypothetical protein OK454_12430, partial [Thaumarchaeota archaeon]|nr:hypothetical protein [Nitrososphaerota archaeon]